ncbi:MULTISPECIES: hypothetical protein [Streptomyces]|uniref:hypothetical protein n=1 Tax=Streptomyces TaxID=1883 RepID=UPI00068E1B46|nr:MULTISPECIES: hypothetical protein [Streptomyces]
MPLITPTRTLQVVMYLARTNSHFPDRELTMCEAYANAFNWGIDLIVMDDEAPRRAPEHRPMLRAALQRLLDKQAGAILVPSRATISPIEGEFNDFAKQVEKASGFIQVATRRCA